jgi:hypothetical protein
MWSPSGAFVEHPSNNQPQSEARRAEHESLVRAERDRERRLEAERVADAQRHADQHRRERELPADLRGEVPS